MEEYFKAVKVTENVYWVGAIDWSIRNFHGYETGRGSTYNAFLVLDEKITLIDSVKGPFVGELLALEIVDTFLDTPFSNGERHKRRIEKLMAVEQG